MRRELVAKSAPTPGDVHVNVPLTNISVAYVQRAEAFVADKVFPVVPVAKQSDVYYKYDRNDFLRDEAKTRAPATESAGGSFNITTANYSCVVEAFHKDIDDQMRSNADSVLQLDRTAAEFVTQKMLIRRERKWATSYFTTGVWATDVTPSTLWDDASGGDPQADVETGRLSLKKAAANVPGVKICGVFGAEVMSALKTNPVIREHYKHTTNNAITEAMIARYLGFDEYYIMEAVYASGVEGGTQTVEFIGGKHLLMLAVTSSPSLLTPTAGYMFAWTGFTGSNMGIRTKKFRMDELGADRIEGEQAYDMHVVAADLGYMLDNVIS